MARAGGIGFDLLLNIFFQMPRNAVHPDDHRNYEERSREQEHAFKTIFADLPVFESDGHGETEGSGGGHAVPDELGELLATGAREVDEDDAYDERGFDTFPKSD